MAEDEFTKLYKLMSRRFDKIDKALEDKADKEGIKRIYDYLDRVIKQQEINNDERLVMGYQLERLDKWVHEVADKIGYKLTT